MPISAPSGNAAERSRSSPSPRIANAALARPGPIAAAASAPDAPSASCNDVPSGNFTVIFWVAASIRPCYPRNHKPLPQADFLFCRAIREERGSHSTWGTLAGLTDGYEGAGGLALGAWGFPEDVGRCGADAAQADEGWTCAERFRDDEADAARRIVVRFFRGSDADPSATELPGDVGGPLFVVEQL